MASFNGYSYQRKLTINHANVSESETNFPVLFQFTDVTISTGTGGHLLNSSGYDLGFYSDPSCGSSFAMNWDTETVNTTGSSQANIFVKMPAISSSTDIVSYLCYGNSAISSYQGISSATWDANFREVMHLGNGVTVLAVDSTGKNTPTNNGATATNGIIDGAINTTTSKTVDTGYRWENATSSITASIWFKTTASGAFNLAFSNFSGGDSSIQIYQNTSNNMEFGLEDSAENCLIGATSTSTYNDGNWHYAVGSYRAGDVGHLYIDGVDIADEGSGTCDGTYDSGDSIHLGTDGLNIAPFNGSLDEFEISNSKRTDGWIKDSFNNQSSPSTFMTIGQEIGPPIPFSDQFNGGTRIKGKTTVL